MQGPQRRRTSFTLLGHLVAAFALEILLGHFCRPNILFLQLITFFLTDHRYSITVFTASHGAAPQPLSAQYVK